MAESQAFWNVYGKTEDLAPGPGVNEPSIFSGGDGIILFEGEPLARRVESSVEVALDWDEVYFQGQYTVGALVLKSIKITGGIKQATADLRIVMRWMGLFGPDGQLDSIGGEINEIKYDTIRDVRYIPPVDIVLVLDKSMIPESVASYEAILIYNAQMNSFSLPIAAASTVFNDQKWTAMNIAFKHTATTGKMALDAGGGKFIGKANPYGNKNEINHPGGRQSTAW